MPPHLALQVHVGPIWGPARMLLEPFMRFVVGAGRGAHSHKPQCAASPVLSRITPCFVSPGDRTGCG